MRSVVIALFFIATHLSADAPTYGSLKVSYEVVNVYEGASAKSKVAGKAEEGDTFELRGDKSYNGFYKIQYGKQVCFVMASQVKLLGDLPAKLPTEVPTPVAKATPKSMTTMTQDHDDDDEDHEREATKVPTPKATVRPTAGHDDDDEDHEHEATKVPTPKATVRPTAGHDDDDDHEHEATKVPTPKPTLRPTLRPTEVPTEEPTEAPTAVPTKRPTLKPTEVPTEEPTEIPTAVPTKRPTLKPTEIPTAEPTEEPTAVPTKRPTLKPTLIPTEEATEVPTAVPTVPPTAVPTSTSIPTRVPTARPTAVPTQGPSVGKARRRQGQQQQTQVVDRRERRSSGVGQILYHTGSSVVSNLPARDPDKLGDIWLYLPIGVGKHQGSIKPAFKPNADTADIRYIESSAFLGLGLEARMPAQWLRVSGDWTYFTHRTKAAEQNKLAEKVDLPAPTQASFPESDVYYQVNTHAFRLGLKASLPNSRIEPWVNGTLGAYVWNAEYLDGARELTYGADGGLAFGGTVGTGIDFHLPQAHSVFTITPFVEWGAPIVHPKINDIGGFGQTWDDKYGTLVAPESRVGIQFAIGY